MGFAPAHTMRIAQRLYEGIDIGGETTGLITYMRTDGVQIDNSAITQARKRTADAGLTAQVRFEVASAQTFNGGPYDLVTSFDCLHDMGDPLGAATHIRGCGF